MLVWAQAYQAHVMSVLCKYTFSQESRCRVTSNRCFNFTFFYDINKGDLPLMYSCVFWCEFIDLVGLFSYYEESDRGHTITAKKMHQTTQEYIIGRSPLFML